MLTVVSFCLLSGPLGNWCRETTLGGTGWGGLCFVIPSFSHLLQQTPLGPTGILGACASAVAADMLTALASQGAEASKKTL